MAKEKAVTILLVEDDDIDARAVTRGFRGQNIGNPIVRARDGIEALEILRGAADEKLDRPYVILLDLNLPRMNGIEFLGELRKDSDLHRSIVFVLTTSNDDRDKIAAYDKNVAGYILKSEAGTDFLDLAQMLDRYVITVQFPDEG